MKPRPSRHAGGSSGDWLAHAESDLNLARLARHRSDVLPEQVCFHAQQAAEKVLKAVLLHRGVAFPRTHDIQQLIVLVRQSGLGPSSELGRAAALTPYAAEARYPDYPDEITPEEVDEAIQLAEAVLSWGATLIRSIG